MNRLRNAGVLALVVVGMLCGVTQAIMFTWIGTSGAWNTPSKWQPDSFFCYSTCYPQTTADDALIEKVVVVTLIDEQIDDLTLSNETNSDAGPIIVGGETAVTLTVETLTVNGGDDADTIVQVTKGARIVAE
jgi:hypothetical protein